MSTRDPARWMWADACQMLAQAERLHRQFFGPGAGPASGPCWEPPADVLEDERHLLVVLALPGVPAERIEIRIEPGALVVVGARTPPGELRRARIRRLEIPYGRFERRLELPLDGLELARQAVADGCLHLLFRKS